MQITRAISGVDLFTIPGLTCLAVDWDYEMKFLFETLIPVGVQAFLLLPAIVGIVCGMLGWIGIESKKPEKSGIRSRVRAVLDHSRMKAVLSCFFWGVSYQFFLIYPTISMSVLQTFRCDDKLRVLTVDYRAVCPLDDMAGFNFQWALIFTVVYPIGIPLAMYLMMRRVKVPQLAKARMNKALLQELIKLWQKEMQTPESVLLASVVGSPAGGEEQQEQFKKRVAELFEQIDADGSGTLDVDELVEAFHTLGMTQVTEESINALLVEYGHEEGEEIDQDSFEEIVIGLAKTSFQFTGYEDVDDLNLEQLAVLCKHEWRKDNKAGGEGGRSTLGRTPSSFRRSTSAAHFLGDDNYVQGNKLPDLENSDAMKKFVFIMAHKLRKDQKIALGVIEWDKNDKEHEKAISRVGCFICPYKVEFWYFEIVDYIKKFLLTSVLSFFMYGEALQLYVGFMMLATALIIMVKEEPYCVRALNGFHIYSNVIQNITLLYGMCLKADYGTAVRQDFRQGLFAEFIFFLIVTMPLFPIASTVKMYFGMIIKTFRNFLFRLLCPGLYATRLRRARVKEPEDGLKGDDNETYAADFVMTTNDGSNTAELQPEGDGPQWRFFDEDDFSAPHTARELDGDIHGRRPELSMFSVQSNACVVAELGFAGKDEEEAHLSPDKKTMEDLLFGGDESVSEQAKRKRAAAAVARDWGVDAPSDDSQEYSSDEDGSFESFSESEESSSDEKRRRVPDTVRRMLESREAAPVQVGSDFTAQGDVAINQHSHVSSVELGFGDGADESEDVSVSESEYSESSEEEDPRKVMPPSLAEAISAENEARARPPGQARLGERTMVTGADLGFGDAADASAEEDYESYTESEESSDDDRRPLPRHSLQTPPPVTPQMLDANFSANSRVVGADIGFEEDSGDDSGGEEYSESGESSGEERRGAR
eukprot:CAMPEP_0172002690 /NCGR_PEP_ID=MMETSP1041-20130122/3542_1 /TAXON_ID=464988 /ORGANISM="Hemiselmis andersenii, Strain CCMP439" /LENGTH=931 /DNA_ID=CAMNT_0012656423 /DNA_START=1 /DNA_END=2796 /DNA_ORIENTATION=-